MVVLLTCGLWSLVHPCAHALGRLLPQQRPIPPRGEELPWLAWDGRAVSENGNSVVWEALGGGISLVAKVP